MLHKHRYKHTRMWWWKKGVQVLLKIVNHFSKLTNKKVWLQTVMPLFINILPRIICDVKLRRLYQKRNKKNVRHETVIPLVILVNSYIHIWLVILFKVCWQRGVTLNCDVIFRSSRRVPYSRLQVGRFRHQGGRRCLLRVQDQVPSQSTEGHLEKRGKS